MAIDLFSYQHQYPNVPGFKRGDTSAQAAKVYGLPK
jgi:hypothetical protein